MAQGIDRRRAILRYVKAYWKKNGYAPSLDDIAGSVELSRNATKHHLDKLIDEGYMERTPGRYRSLRVISDARY